MLGEVTQYFAEQVRALMDTVKQMDVALSKVRYLNLIMCVVCAYSIQMVSVRVSILCTVDFSLTTL